MAIKDDTEEQRKVRMDRREALTCMTWAGTGLPSTAFPQPVPGTAPSPGPMKVPAGELRNYLGIASVTYLENNKPLAIVDTPLAG